MPITLNCPCGKTLRVADEHAGKRVKCPVCNAVIAPPAPEPQFEVVEEAPPLAVAAAKPKVKPRDVDEEDEDGSYNMETAAKKPEPPKKQPQFRKRANADDEEEDDHSLPRRRQSEADAGATAGKRIAYIVGGGFGLVAGSALAIWAYGGTGRGSTKLMVIGVCVAIVGLVSLFQGITGTIPEGE